MLLFSGIPGRTALPRSFAWPCAGMKHNCACRPSPSSCPTSGPGFSRKAEPRFFLNRKSLVGFRQILTWRTGRPGQQVQRRLTNLDGSFVVLVKALSSGKWEPVLCSHWWRFPSAFALTALLKGLFGFFLNVLNFYDTYLACWASPNHRQHLAVWKPLVC